MQTTLDPLRFDPDAYQVKTCTLDGESITYRAFEGLRYCARPEDPIQMLNLFAPEALYQGQSLHGYTLHTAPIFVLNTVGGYMPGPATEPGRDFKGNINMLFRCLQHGYVVASVGVRGRTSGTRSDDFFVGGVVRGEEAVSDHFTGKAPALVVDMKAALRYLRHNKDRIPGDTERFVTSGTSAGGALSALTGATGNSADYLPYLAAIGAAEERDDIFAANCYCPIHNLEHADAAYEWEFSGIWEYHRTRHSQQGGKVVRVPVTGELTPAQQELSRALKAQFPAYLNGLGLTAPDGTPLTLDAAGNGSFKDYVKGWLIKSAQRELETRSSCEGLPELAVAHARPEDLACLTLKNGRVTGLDWDGYLRFITRMKAAPAFDALDMSSPENEEFGTEQCKARHFTAFSLAHSTAAQPALAGPELVRQMNPLAYIGTEGTAPHWRVRHGAADRDTSFAIPVILATVLQNRGYDVDFFLPWALPHSGEYDLPELFRWVDERAGAE